ncbi:MAG: ABC transporter ATP-binding protein [Cellulosilyticaceae bacterium]
MLKRLYQVVPYWLLAIIAVGLLAVLEGYLFIRMMDLLDLALSKNMLQFKEKGMMVIVIAAALVPIAVVSTLAKNLYKKKANEKLKNYYISKVFDKNISEFHKENNSKYISSLTNDFNTLETHLIDTIYTIGEGAISFLVGVWIVVTVNSWMLILVAVIMGINLIISLKTAKPVARQTKERSDLFDGYTAYIKEVLSAFHIIKNNNLQDRIRDNFYEKSEGVQRKGYVIDKLLSCIYSIETVNIYFDINIATCIAGYLALSGQASVGGTVLIIQGLQRMMGPLNMMTEAIPKIFTVKDLVKKVEATLENEKSYEETVAIEGLEQEIRFEEVSFGYEEGLVLEKINLSLKKGGKYLIVGPSGGGKSTLLKLLRKYFNPLEGTIWLDGNPLKDIQKETYFGTLANVEQQVFIFEDTLRNNLTLYKDYSEEELWEAISKAGLKDFIDKQEQGLEMMIFENGKNISGGERSRIVIARGLLGKADIILLDEAFASLDMVKAREIEEELLRLEGVTIINVSHVIFEENKSKYDGIYNVKHKKVYALTE